MNFRISPLLVIISCCFLQGCPASVYELNRLPSSSPLPKALAISAPADYVHKQSGYAFPVKVAQFKRVALLRYDTAGLDMSAGYNGAEPSCPVRLTVYVSPAPRMSFIGADPAVVRSLETRWVISAYERWKKEISHEHSQATLVEERERVHDGVASEKAVYMIDGDQSELFIFLVKNMWLLTYRTSFPASCSVDAQAQLNGFFGSWHGHVQ